MNRVLYFLSIVVLILNVSTDKLCAATNMYQHTFENPNPPVEGRKTIIKKKSAREENLISLSSKEKKPEFKLNIPRWYILAGALLCILLGIIIKAVLPITANFAIVWIFETIGLVTLFVWVVLWVRDIGMKYGETHPTNIHRRRRRGVYRR
jgi:hypothetical protein